MHVNCFPFLCQLKNEDRVLSSPRRRTKSGSTDSSSPAPRISWLTAGLSGCGGQVMLNEKGKNKIFFFACYIPC